MTELADLARLGPVAIVLAAEEDGCGSCPKLVAHTIIVVVNVDLDAASLAFHGTDPPTSWPPATATTPPRPTSNGSNADVLPGITRPAEESAASVFFIERRRSSEPAKQLCARCIVRDDCLNEALTDPYPDLAMHGIRAGLGPCKVAQLRRRQVTGRSRSRRADLNSTTSTLAG